MSFEIKNGVLKNYWEEDGVTEVTIPDSVKSIGYMVFGGCESLTSITIPDSVTSIGSSAFDCCKSLTGITIPDSVTSIGYSAFSWCKSLASIKIPDRVTYIGNWTFSDCKSLKSITIPDKVTYIGNWAFSGCESLESITIPDSVTSIGNCAFEHCKSLTSVTIPDSVISIGARAFSGCKKLTSITIPDSVTYIGKWAFYGCESLESITIPDSVTNIVYKALPVGKKIIICKNDIKVPFILKDTWNGKKSERLLIDFIVADINNRQKYFNKLKLYYKIPLAMFMVYAYPQVSSDYLSYLKKSTKKAVKFMTDEEFTDLLCQFLELGFVTKKNIDDLISYAVEHKQNGGSEVPQSVLEKYKSDNLS